MRQFKQYLIVVFMFVFSINALAQKVIEGYNPFVAANLDDSIKLSRVDIVESSYHRYSIKGDVNYTDTSNFVWYVENGTLGIYDELSDSWTPFTGDTAISNGRTIDLLGDGNNRSEVWVKWNDASLGSVAYIAVYERSSKNCIFENQITGYKHNILVAPQIWFLVGTRFECSDQVYSVTAKLNELRENSFPYRLNYTYPGIDGSPIVKDTTITVDDLDMQNQLTWDLYGVNDLLPGIDETYTISLNILRDKYGALGKIAPLGPGGGQFNEITIKIYHLPQTGGMRMDQ